MSKGPTTRYKVEVQDGARTSRREDTVVTEEPLELRLEWPGRAPEPLVVTMRTPGSDFELAAGFCLGEGFAVRPGAISTVAYCTDVKLTREQQFNTVTVTFDGPPDREPPQRYGVTSAACGVCGQQSLDEPRSATTARSTRWRSRWTSYCGCPNSSARRNPPSAEPADSTRPDSSPPTAARS